MRARLSDRWFGVTVAAAVAVSCGSTGRLPFDGRENPADAGPDSPALVTSPSLDGSFSLGGEDHDAGPKVTVTCAADADCGAGGVCDLATLTCGCGGVSVNSSVVTPSLLMVEDRSCSMTELVGGMTKWTIAVNALKSLTTQHAGKIDFGLSLFPDITGAACTQDAMAIPVGPANESKIQTLLTNALVKSDPLFPKGPCVTNIDSAMVQAVTEPAFADAARGRYVLLVTDGEQSGCTAGGGNPGTLQAITDLHTKGVTTFVVAFGSMVDTVALNSFAVAGGQPNQTPPNKYYQADDQASLDAVLAGIVKSIPLGCDLKLAGPPPGGDPSLIFVYFNKTPPPVKRDTSHVNGWDYDPTHNLVHFYGGACDQLTTGTVKDARVVFGCPNGPPPPPPN